MKDFKQKRLQEFKKMRNLMNYMQVWKIHPIGAAIDIDEWIEILIDEAIEEGKKQ